MRRLIAFCTSLLLLLTLLSSCAKPINKMSAAELLDLGEKYLLEMNYEQAVVYFDRLIEIDPKNPNGYMGLAETYVAQGNFIDAIYVMQDGIEQLEDDDDFLDDVGELCEDILNEEPSSAKIYIRLAEIYDTLGDEENMIEVLRLGLEQLPDNVRLSELYYAAIIPEYEIQQTLYQELRADDGALLACNSYNQPVFIGSNERVKKMNAVFVNEIAGVNLDDFDYLLELYYARQNYIYEEVNDYGIVGGYTRSWLESCRIKQYISFKAYGAWDNFGVHGGTDMSGRTFDASTGELLTLSDILTVSPDNMSQVLYSEYIAYHDALGDGFADLAMEYPDMLENRCNEDAVFWLENDGVHIYFGEYTFFYAAGPSELVIAYERADLIGPPFSSSSTADITSSSQTSVPWKQLYLDTLLSAQAYSKNVNMSEHDFYGSTYPAQMTASLLADLNFDGIPELMIFGDGAGASEQMRIFTITDAGFVDKIFKDWGDPNDFKLYRNMSDNSLAYCYKSGNGGENHYEGKVYLTDSRTPMNDSMGEIAKIADYTWEYEYEIIDGSATATSSTFTVNGQLVSEDEYNRIVENLLQDYKELSNEPVQLQGLYGTEMTYDDFSAFLDSYVPEQ